MDVYYGIVADVRWTALRPIRLIDDYSEVTGRNGPVLLRAGVGGVRRGQSVLIGVNANDWASLIGGKSILRGPAPTVGSAGPKLRIA